MALGRPCSRQIAGLGSGGQFKAAYRKSFKSSADPYSKDSNQSEPFVTPRMRPAWASRHREKLNVPPSFSASPDKISNRPTELSGGEKSDFGATSVSCEEPTPTAA